MEVLWLKSLGLTHADIAAFADVSPRSVHRYLDEYQEGGLDRIRRLGWQGQPCALDEHQPSLEDYWVSLEASGANHGYVAAGGPDFTGMTDTVGARAPGG
jgi:hypothetical protein